MASNSVSRLLNGDVAVACSTHAGWPPQKSGLQLMTVCMVLWQSWIQQISEWLWHLQQQTGWC